MGPIRGLALDSPEWSRWRRRREKKKKKEMRRRKKSNLQRSWSQRKKRWPWLVKDWGFCAIGFGRKKEFWL